MKTVKIRKDKPHKFNVELQRDLYWTTHPNSKSIFSDNKRPGEVDKKNAPWNITITIPANSFCTGFLVDKYSGIVKRAANHAPAEKLAPTLGEQGFKEQGVIPPSSSNELRFHNIPRDGTVYNLLIICHMRPSGWIDVNSEIQPYRKGKDTDPSVEKYSFSDADTTLNITDALNEIIPNPTNFCWGVGDGQTGGGGGTTDPSGGGDPAGTTATGDWATLPDLPDGGQADTPSQWPTFKGVYDRHCTGMLPDRWQDMVDTNAAMNGCNLGLWVCFDGNMTHLGAYPEQFGDLTPYFRTPDFGGDLEGPGTYNDLSELHYRVEQKLDEMYTYCQSKGMWMWVELADPNHNAKHHSDESMWRWIAGTENGAEFYNMTNPRVNEAWTTIARTISNWANGKELVGLCTHNEIGVDARIPNSLWINTMAEILKASGRPVAVYVGQHAGARAEPDEISLIAFKHGRFDSIVEHYDTEGLGHSTRFIYGEQSNYYRSPYDQNNVEHVAAEFRAADAGNYSISRYWLPWREWGDAEKAGIQMLIDEVNKG